MTNRTLTLGPVLPRKFFRPKGRKAIYLPNFTLTLLNTPHSPPNWCTFLTPLSLNKLDLKDYLYHAYSLHCTSIRSSIHQPRIQRRPGRNSAGIEAASGVRALYRPRSYKKMTAILSAEKGAQYGGPFIWPEQPSEEELRDKWDKGAWEAQEEEMEGERRRMNVEESQGRWFDEKKKVMRQVEEREEGEGRVGEGRERLVEMARRLREGRERWKEEEVGI